MRAGKQRGKKYRNTESGKHTQTHRMTLASRTSHPISNVRKDESGNLSVTHTLHAKACCSLRLLGKKGKHRDNRWREGKELVEEK